MLNNDSRYLLIVGCSQRKREDPGLLPAIERYDGVNFRVIRKAKSEGCWPTGMDLLIISARYGLLSENEPILYYDQVMTKARADELKHSVSANLNHYLAENRVPSTFINLGAQYERILPTFFRNTAGQAEVVFASGGIGQRMSQMKAWLCRYSRTFKV